MRLNQKPLCDKHGGFFTSHLLSTAPYAIFFGEGMIYSPQKKNKSQAQGEKMESGSVVVEKDERKRKYYIYVEEYVLSYLRRESDSLELSEIYFYGSRQEKGRKLYVYGAGRDKGIAAFAEYEPLPELVCRLTQAGPVFLVREPDGECMTTGFQVFYANNEAMQNYLLEWTGSTGKKRAAEKGNEKKAIPAPVVFPEEERKRTPYGAMSVQLCLILVVLVAIVITSTDSYDKMEELNRSAKEVFFAIENQEAGETADNLGQAADSDAAVSGGGQAEDFDRADLTGKKEIVVERDTDSNRETDSREQDAGSDGTGDDSVKGVEPAGTANDPKQDADSDTITDDQIEGTDTDKAVDDRRQDADSDMTADDQIEGVDTDVATDDQSTGADDGRESDNQEQDTAGEEKQEENREALSRSITRYYEVEQGDTLYTISQKIYGDISRVEKICEVNEISDPDKIRSGQRIILP